MGKFALVSHVIPPSSSGQGVVLFRLLEDLKASQYVLLSGGTATPNAAVSKRVAGKSYQLPRYGNPEHMLKNKLMILPEAFLFWLTIRGRVKKMREVIAQEKCNNLVICTGDFADMAAGYFVAKANSDLGFFPYYFDYFSYQFPGMYRRMATWLEKRVMARATKVIVPNEFTGMRVKERYGVETALVRNPLANGWKRPKTVTAPQGKSWNILYMGAIYEAHFDAFRALCAALRALRKAGFKITLDIYTTQTKEILFEQEILVEGDSLIHCHPVVSQEQVPDIQAKADFLYLPLSFGDDYPEIIATSCPGKMAEYMLSGKPILAHVPEDSFVAWYLGTHDAATLIDTLNTQKIVETLKEVLDKPAALKERSQHAIERAAADFDPVKARKALLAALSD